MLDDGDEEGEETLANRHRTADSGAAEGVRKLAAKPKTKPGQRPPNAVEGGGINGGGGIPSWVALAQKLPTGTDDIDAIA